MNPCLKPPAFKYTMQLVDRRLRIACPFSISFSRLSTTVHSSLWKQIMQRMRWGKRKKKIAVKPRRIFVPCIFSVFFVSFSFFFFNNMISFFLLFLFFFIAFFSPSTNCNKRNHVICYTAFQVVNFGRKSNVNLLVNDVDRIWF